MPEKKKIAIAAVVLVAMTWWLATAPESPIRPQPPKPDRPVLRFIFKAAQVAAKIGLMAMWFAEVQPDSDEMPLARASLGIDGHQSLDNARW